MMDEVVDVCRGGRPRQPVVDGVINVHKNKGYTSHDVVAIVRKTFSGAVGTKIKVGHTGTLDPDATGVLPVCLGKATKIADYIMADVKAYTAEIIFGTATDTQDASGSVIAEKATNFTEEQFHAALESFIGEYTQIPPMYSAVKVGGKKLYELAREGKEVARKPRLVEIFGITVQSAELPRRAVICVECSKGTYIRTLCADLGERLGGLAHMGELTRTRSGNFCIENSVEIDEIKRRAGEGTLCEIVTPIEQALPLPQAVACEACEKIMYNGGKLNSRDMTFRREPNEGELLFVVNKEGALVGLYEYTQGILKPRTMLLGGL